MFVKSSEKLRDMQKEKEEEKKRIRDSPSVSKCVKKDMDLIEE